MRWLSRVGLGILCAYSNSKKLAELEAGALRGRLAAFDGQPYFPKDTMSRGSHVGTSGSFRAMSG